MAEGELNYEKEKKNKPICKWKSGPLGAAVWEKEITTTDKRTGEPKQVKLHSITLQRRYFDKENNEWKTSQSIPMDNIPDAVLLLQTCFQYLKLREETDAGADDFETTTA